MQNMSVSADYPAQIEHRSDMTKQKQAPAKHTDRVWKESVSEHSAGINPPDRISPTAQPSGRFRHSAIR